jgi:hypothetical protein
MQSVIRNESLPCGSRPYDNDVCSYYSATVCKQCCCKPVGLLKA